MFIFILSNILEFCQDGRTGGIAKEKKLANNVTWNKVLNAEVLNKLANNKFFEYLPCAENHTIIISYIDRLKSGYFTKVQHYIAIFHPIFARHDEEKQRMM